MSGLKFIIACAIAVFTSVSLYLYAGEILLNEDFQETIHSNGTANPSFTGWTWVDSGNVKSRRADNQTDFPGDTGTPNQGVQFEWVSAKGYYNISHNWSSSDYYTLIINASPQTWNGTEDRYIEPSIRQQDDTVLWSASTLLPDYNSFGQNPWPEELTFTYTINAGDFIAGTEGQPIRFHIQSSGFRGLYIDNIYLELGLVNLSANSLISNYPTGTFVGNLTYNLSASNTSYTLGGSGDNLLFTTLTTGNAVLGELRSNSFLNSGNIYNFTISANNNSGNVTTEDFIIGATSAIAPLVNVDADITTISGNSVIAGITSSSAGQNVTYSIVGGRDDLMDIDSSNLVVKTGSESSWGAVGSIYYVALQASSTGGNAIVNVKVEVAASSSGTLIRFN